MDHGLRRIFSHTQLSGVTCNLFEASNWSSCVSCLCSQGQCGIRLELITLQVYSAQGLTSLAEALRLIYKNPNSCASLLQLDIL